MTGAFKGSGFEVGASAQRERFVEEVVTPTAVSDYVRLLRRLDEGKHLRRLTPDRKDFRAVKLTDGQFVLVRTDQLRFPDYMAPYVIVRQSGTLRALFPTSGTDRQAARGFARRVGPNPRVTFVLEAQEENGRPARYLMPMQYARLTDERSLLSGGSLTIVGKVIRSFPELADASGRVVYRDFPTRETWRGALSRAPDSLLRRAIRTKKVIERCRLSTVPKARRCLITALNEQTRIHRPSAILIPTGIYK